MDNTPSTDPVERLAKLPAMVTYDQVIRLHERLTEVVTKVDQLLTLHSDLKHLDGRVRDVENTLAAGKGTISSAAWLAQMVHWLTTAALAGYTLWQTFHP
jgi:hypothetical protein